MDNTGNNKNPTVVANSGNNQIAVVAALVVIVIVALVGYYWYHNIYSRGTLATKAITAPPANKTQASSITTTTQQFSKPMNVSGTNGIFNGVSNSQQKPPTPPSSVG